MKQATTILVLLLYIASYSQVTLDYAIIESYNTTSSQYSNSEKEVYQYDASGNLTETLFLHWVSSSWTNSQNEVNTYDSNGNKIQSIISIWNVATNQWDFQYKNDNVFNSNNLVTEILSYNWNGSQWIEDQKINITYLANNKLNQFISYDWDGAQWQVFERGTATYTSGALETLIYDLWVTNQWVADAKDTYTINAGTGKIEEVLYQSWDGASWNNEEKETFILDTNLNKLSSTDSYFDGSNWVLNYKTDHSYDTNTLLSAIYHPFNDIFYSIGTVDFPFTNKVIEEINSDYNSGWDISSRTTYHYSNDTAGVNDFNLLNVKVFPNPTLGVFKIEIQNLEENATLEIYDLLGKQIQTEILNADTTQLDISKFANGVYFLRFISDGKVTTKRIIKK